MNPFALCVALCCADAPDQRTLERQFAEALTGAALVGSFTVDGKGKPPAADRYEIFKASKVSGSRWEITARIKWDKYDFKVPVPVEVKWAGETATIQVTDLALPLVAGKFRTRLLIDGDRYAGTWSHDQVGGHMWGKIEKSPAGAPAPAGKSAK